MSEVGFGLAPLKREAVTPEEKAAVSAWVQLATANQPRKSDLISNAAHALCERYCGPRETEEHKMNYPGILALIEVLISDLDGAYDDSGL